MSIDIAEILSSSFANDYNLTYRCQINLEGTINNMLFYGLSQQTIEDILRDIYDNLEFSKDKD
jgi:hypothetical protein